MTYKNDRESKGYESLDKDSAQEIVIEFLKGREYRFLVIDGKIEGILNRVPANVRGDGKASIRELVTEKNKDLLRGEGHKTPLEKINLSESESMFLKSQNLSFDYKPDKGEIVYLRENSNISTGGDSIDYTDIISKPYKDLAIKSAEIVGAKLCGVDMMIEDIEEEPTQDNYGIIELNFNPAVHIHSFPYRGRNRKIGDKILDALDM